MNYNEERIERMKALIDLLKTIPQDRFDLDSWAEPTMDDKGHICKTCACAIGWAAGTPEVAKKLGIALGVIVSIDHFEESQTIKKFTKMESLDKFLRMSDDEVSYDQVTIIATKPLKRQGEKEVTPIINNFEGFDAAARALFISRSASEYLFASEKYEKHPVTASDVADRLQIFIDKSNKATIKRDAYLEDFGIGDC